MDTLYGLFQVNSPRLRRCSCQVASGVTNTALQHLLPTFSRSAQQRNYSAFRLSWDRGTRFERRPGCSRLFCRVRLSQTRQSEIAWDALPGSFPASRNSLDQLK